MEKKVANSPENKKISTENTNENQHKAENKTGDAFNSGIEEKFEKDKNYPADVDADKQDTGMNKNNFNPQKSVNEKSSAEKHPQETEKMPSH